jgi:L,D-transpeptidase catalytic domain
MLHSIFFHGGYAIHGSYEINRLGGPASHGCIRLHPANAAALFQLVICWSDVASIRHDGEPILAPRLDAHGPEP